MRSVGCWSPVAEVRLDEIATVGDAHRREFVWSEEPMVRYAVGQRDGGDRSVRLLPLCNEEHVARFSAKIRERDGAVVEKLQTSRCEFDSGGGTERPHSAFSKIKHPAVPVGGRCPDLWSSRVSAFQRDEQHRATGDEEDGDEQPVESSEGENMTSSAVHRIFRGIGVPVRFGAANDRTLFARLLDFSFPASELRTTASAWLA